MNKKHQKADIVWYVLLWTLLLAFAWMLQRELWGDLWGNVWYLITHL